MSTPLYNDSKSKYRLIQVLELCMDYHLKDVPHLKVIPVKLSQPKF